MWNEKSEIYYEKSSLCKKGNIKTQFYFIAGRNTNLQEKYTQYREKKAKVYLLFADISIYKVTQRIWQRGQQNISKTFKNCMYSSHSFPFLVKNPFAVKGQPSFVLWQGNILERELPKVNFIFIMCLPFSR